MKFEEYLRSELTKHGKKVVEFHVLAMLHEGGPTSLTPTSVSLMFTPIMRPGEQKYVELRVFEVNGSMVIDPNPIATEATDAMAFNTK